MTVQMKNSKLDLRDLNRGFTLIEVTVATAVAGIIIVLMMTFIANTMATHARDTVRADMLLETQLTLDNIGREIRLSANADENNRWPDDNAPDDQDQYSWTSSANTLILATAALDSNKNVLFSDPLHYITSKNNNIYFVKNSTLYKRVLADPVSGNVSETTCPPSPSDSCPDDRELVHNVKSFSVRYYDSQNTEVEPDEAQSIELSLSLEKIKYNQAISASFSTRTVFRNE